MKIARRECGNSKRTALEIRRRANLLGLLLVCIHNDVVFEFQQEEVNKSKIQTDVSVQDQFAQLGSWGYKRDPYTTATNLLQPPPRLLPDKTLSLVTPQDRHSYDVLSTHISSLSNRPQRHGDRVHPRDLATWAPDRAYPIRLLE